MRTDPAAECLVQLVQQLRLPVARRRVYEELHRHPDYPSLLASSDVLHAWGVLWAEALVGGASLIITMVMSPTCPPCARAHAVLDEWLVRRDDVQVQVVFTVPHAPQETDYQAAAHLMALHQQKPETVREALHTWYAQDHKNYAAWAGRYPVELAAADAGWLPKHLAWCRQATVAGTPTILFNGQKLPEPYQLEDIKYFL